MKKPPSKWEKIFTVLSLINFSGGPLVLILSGGSSEGDGSDSSADFAIIQALFLLIYLISAILLVKNSKSAINILKKDRLILMLTLWALFSIAWSDAPNITTTKSIALLGSNLFALYLASRYTLKEQLQLLGTAFGIILISSIFMIIFLPSYGRMGGQHSGAFRGIFNHKNVLGKVMNVSLIIFLLLAINEKKRKFKMWLGVIVSILLIIVSRSSSSVVNMIMIFASFFVFRLLKAKLQLLIPALMGLSIVTLILYFIIGQNAEALAGLFGKDLTLTGRTDMWEIIIEKAHDRPILGYGFSAFWLGLDGPSADIWIQTGFKAPNGHNGYLDLLVELGIIGIIIYGLAFMNGLIRGLIWLRGVKESTSLFPLMYLTFIILSNLTESTLLIQNNLFWLLQATLIFTTYNTPEKDILPVKNTKVINKYG